MLIKSKVFRPQSDPRLKAGDEAERQMAFLLDRRFEERDDVFLLHDLRIQKGKHFFQIDHLVVTRYGIALIESKSIHSKVSITRHDERREHWSREFRGRNEGIPSPVRQVQEQARQLQEYLRENAEQILGKMLGLLQKGFGYCPFDTYVGVSTSAVFSLSRGTPLPEHVFKADEVAPEIDRLLKAREKHGSFLNLNPLTAMPWEMSRDEALAAARFLMRHHTPLVPAAAPETAAPPATDVGTAPAPVVPATPQVGSLCPACGAKPLAVAAAGPVKANGSRDRYLACLGNRDGSCDWKTPFEPPRVAEAPAAYAVADTPAPPAEAEAPAPPGRSESKYFCFDCRVAIPKEVARFCWDRKERFGGKAYCRSCQARFQGRRQASA
ncbi:nuclease-related domain-containing protein [Zoogloea sp.]|uniref:nuclease-related domain-containing protein n=1 Tax=Zoogloea sp. TaxID=49181 RepID=UPI002625498E|nr:nuclease-related domain-containing protein [uncultured Zoogloea sp.]